MKNLNLALKLKYLHYLKSLGFCYVKPIKDFEIKESFELPSSMAGLKTTVLGCHLCELAKTRTNVVFGEGNENARVMFVGEGPGEAEDKSAKPFVGKAGELLTKMIENAIGIKREDAYIANIVKCRPPNNRVPAPSEVASCKPYLEKQIELIKPELIVALGATALNSLLGQNHSIMKVRGTLMEYKGAKLIPTFHPSFLLRNPSAKKEAYADMLLIKSLLWKH
ncbi:MAG: uracil-DNA glycosylase [Campylobacteraceae bacterium]|jgi:DNA polymerase|nr:uracil-DNA glycosylase [Campylobacteraceae bacterium]